MPRRPKSSLPTHRDVAELIVREQKSPLSAARELGLEWTAEDCEQIYKSAEFQATLWDCRFRYYTEIANQPGRTKAAALGLMTLALQNLAAEGEWEKVVEGVLKLGRLEGWTNGDSTVQVFANLTAKDIEEAKKQLTDLVKPERGAGKAAPDPTAN